MNARLLVLITISVSLFAPYLDGQVEPTTPYVWKNVPIVGGGYITGVFAHPAVHGLFYAKTDIGGAYRRDSANGPWIAITDWIGQDDWNYSGMESLALDPRDADAVYLAGGSYTNQWGGNGAFLLSHDRGRTWKTVSVPFKMGGNENGRSQGERLVVDPNDGRVLFFGSRKNGLWKSSDRGMSWAQVTTFPLPNDAKQFGIPFVQFNAASGQPGTPTPVIIIGCDSLTTPIVRSPDAGKTWMPISGSPKGFFPNRAAYAAGGSLIVTFSNGVGPSGITDGAVFRLEADERTWSDITPLKPGGNDVFGYCGVCIDPHDPKTVIVSTLDRWVKVDDIFRTHDNGHTWTSLGKNSVRDTSLAPWLKMGKSEGPTFGHWISSVAIDPSDSQHIMYVTGWGMWESRDTASADKDLPTHWTIAASGINEGVMTDVISPPKGPQVLSALWDIDGFAYDDIDRTPPNGFFKPWTGRNSAIDFAARSPNVIVRVFGGQVLGRPQDAAAGGAISQDSGKTWSLFTGKPKRAVDGSVALLADGMTILWTPEKQGTVRSSGRNRDPWAPVTGLPANLRVVADRVDTSKAYSFDSASGTLYSSNDRGATFKPAAIDLPKENGVLQASISAAGNLWLASKSGVYRSTNFGSSFKKMSGLDSASCVGFGAAMKGSTFPAIYVVGRQAGKYGFFRSDDDGQSWTRINDDAHQFMEIAAISGDPRVPGRVYIASRSRGLVRGDLPH